MLQTARSPSGTTPTDQTRRQRGRTAAVTVALACASAALVGALTQLDGVLGRFTGTTTNEGSFFEAGAVDIVTGDGRNGEAATAEIAIEASGLAPGIVVERCIPATYRGTIDGVELRLHGRPDGGTGLERYLATRIEVGSGNDAQCADFIRDDDFLLLDGTLGELHRRHDGWETGVVLRDSLDDGDAVTLRVALSVVSDNRAQGLDTEFWLTLEARA